LEILEQIGRRLKLASRRTANAYRNTNRAVADLSNRIVKAGGRRRIDKRTLICLLRLGRTISARFFGPGVTMHWTATANDYLGKGPSGGRIVVITPPGSPFDPKEKHYRRQIRCCTAPHPARFFQRAGRRTISRAQQRRTRGGRRRGRSRLRIHDRRNRGRHDAPDVILPPHERRSSIRARRESTLRHTVQPRHGRTGVRSGAMKINK